MRNSVKPFLAVAALAAAVLAASCQTVDPNASAASAGAVAAAQVAILDLPYDQSLPRFVVAIEPFAYGAEGSNVTSGDSMATAPEASSSSSVTAYGIGGDRRRHRGAVAYDVSASSGLQGGSTEGAATTTHDEPTGYGPGVSAQFMTALTHWPNVSVVDWAVVQANKDGSYSTKLNPGEIGPFIVRGVVTEFNETSQASGGNTSVSLGTVGSVLAMAGVRGGAELAAINPEYKSSKQVRQGTVGVDLTLLDGRTGRVIRAYNCSGTFTTQSAVNGLSIAGIGGGNSQFAASALGQATRAAMNDAVQKTADALRVAPR